GGVARAVVCPPGVVAGRRAALPRRAGPAGGATATPGRGAGPTSRGSAKRRGAAPPGGVLGPGGRPADGPQHRGGGRAATPRAEGAAGPPRRIGEPLARDDDGRQADDLP